MKKLMGWGLLIGLAACTPKGQLEKDLEQVLKDKPEILLNVIEAHPDKFIESLNKAVQSAQMKKAEERKKDEDKQLADSYENPLVPQIRADENIRGPKNAPLVLVEYSDFECPFCTRGYQTMISLMKKYEGKIQFIYKHLPLSFHPQAMPAAQYYEALRLQGNDKAQKFHDEIFEDQKKLANGEKFLKATAQKVGANMAKLEKDLNSEEVKTRIKQDMEEAAKFGFQGTPGFLLNGIPVKGAYPVEHFEVIIQELKKRGKVTL
jgi:protein-disulfide isomerase